MIVIDHSGFETSSATVTDSITEASTEGEVWPQSTFGPFSGLDNATDSSDIEVNEEPNDFDRFRGPYVNMVDLEHLNDATLSDASSQPELVFNPSREECWLVTPSPCFTVDSEEESRQVTTGSLEKLLIEHPSMSVYQSRGRRPVHGAGIGGSRLLRVATRQAEFSSRESLAPPEMYNTNVGLDADAMDSEARAGSSLDPSYCLQPWLADSESSSLNTSFTTDSPGSANLTYSPAEGNDEDLRRLIPAMTASPRRKHRKGSLQKGHGNLSRAALDRRNKVLCDNLSHKTKYHHKNHSCSSSGTNHSSS